MRRIVVLVTLALSFLAPLAISVAEAAEPGTVQAVSHRSECRNRRAKKQQDESKPKKKDKDKDGKKPYGFEL
jgi:hypothetical protein